MQGQFEYGNTLKSITRLSGEIATYILQDEILRNMAIEYTGQKPFILSDANVFTGVSKFLRYDDEDGNIQNDNMNAVIISVVVTGFGSDVQDEDGDTYGLQIQFATRDTRALQELNGVWVSKERRYIDSCMVRVGEYLMQNPTLCRLYIGNYMEIDITPSGEMDTILGALIFKLTTGERTL